MIQLAGGGEATPTLTSRSNGHSNTPTLWSQLRMSATRTQIECELLAFEMEQILSSPGQAESIKSELPTAASSGAPSGSKLSSLPSWMTPLSNL